MLKSVGEQGLIDTHAPVVMDVVILSFAKNAELRLMTEHCLSTLLASEDPAEIIFRVVVVESNHASPAYVFDGVETIYLPPPFNYHRYMNRGIMKGSGPFVAICNNDLEFHKGWAASLLKAFSDDDALVSVSPICSLHHPANGFHVDTGIHHGYGVLKEISGWCLVFRRGVLNVIGSLDERFYFWYADNDYALTLQAHGLKHALVTSSVVDHLDSRTLNTHTSARQWLMTKRAKYIFEEKWKGRSWGYLMRKRIKLYLKFPFYYLGLKKVK